MTAQLAMYDWPEIRPATDRLWTCLRAALAAEGIAAPARLDRAPDPEPDPEAAWLDPGLVLAQTCGLPYVQRLAPRVALLGAPDYALPGTPPGFYRSIVVARATDPGRAPAGLAAFRGARLAVNSPCSQSGLAAILHHAAPLARDGRFFGAVTLTGSHVASIRAVVAGTAEIAAIDAVSWRLARRHLPGAASLQIVTQTDPTPGLPLITAAGADLRRFRRAIVAAIAALDARARTALGIAGFRPFEPDDYSVIAARLSQARARLHRDPAAALTAGLTAPSDSVPA